MAESLIPVRVTTSFPAWPLLRQTPGWSGVWGKYQYFVDTEVENYDFWVFLEAPWLVLRGRFNPENTVFVSAEPPSIRQYPKGYLDQFGTIVTCHDTVEHRDVRFMQQALPWYYAAWIGPEERAHPRLDYDRLKTHVPQKSRTLSIVSSNLNRTRGHNARLAFATELKQRLGDQVDFFGRGIRSFQDKAEPIEQYRYHIAIENCQCRDYWTEKLADPFLGNSFPFYYGCPNIASYFPAGSYCPIDVTNIAQAIETIETTVAAGTFEKSQHLLKQARELVLDRYNIFALVSQVLDTKSPGGPERDLEFRPREQFEASGKKIVRAISKASPAWLRRLLR